MEKLTDDRFLKDGFYQPKSKEEAKEIRSMGNDLTFEKLYKHCAEVEKQNVELQKQVDERENEIDRLEKVVHEQAEQYWDCKEQAVKDTAKEILTELFHVNFETKCTVSNYRKSKEDIEIVAKAILAAINEKIKEIAKRKGVEVE